MTVTINNTTTTTDARAADTGSEPAADSPALAPEHQHSDGFEPRSTSIRSRPAPDDLGVSDEQEAGCDDPPSHAIGRQAGS